MAPLTRDQILQAPDLPRETVAVPEWGGTVLVRGLTAAERDAWEASQISPDGTVTLANIRARLVAFGTIDETGAPLFTEADVTALAQKNGKAVARVAQAIRDLSGLGPDAEKQIEGNSDGAPAADSPSSSPVNSGT